MCACVDLLFNTQMCECAAYTFPNISPLMQGTVTFPNNMGGWGWFLGIPHTELFLELFAAVFVKGEGGETYSVCPEES